MPEPLKVGDIHKSLKAQVEASQKIYQTVVDLADIADQLDDAWKQKLEQLMQDLVKVGDSLSENVDETTKLVQKSLQPAR